jgi:hypothetical protein
MKSLVAFTRNFFNGYLSFIASLASIIGLILTFCIREWAVVIALITFVIFLTLILIRFFIVVKTFLLSKTIDGFHRFATYIRYSTEDGCLISYEVHKFLQCKIIASSEHIHKYHWSGSKNPVINSDLQEIAEIRIVPDDYDEIVLRFKKPLTYNEFAVVHIKM